MLYEITWQKRGEYLFRSPSQTLRVLISGNLVEGYLLKIIATDPSDPGQNLALLGRSAAESYLRVHGPSPIVVTYLNEIIWRNEGGKDSKTWNVV